VIAEPIVEGFETTVATEVGESIAADMAADLEATAGAVPDIETAERKPATWTARLSKNWSGPGGDAQRCAAD
jgi:hypothetical protein